MPVSLLGIVKSFYCTRAGREKRREKRNKRRHIISFFLVSLSSKAFALVGNAYAILTGMKCRALAGGSVSLRGDSLASKTALFAQSGQSASRHRQGYVLSQIIQPRQKSSVLARQRFTSEGYTILEVMIVMTVTATMFVIVATLFGGRQAATELRQSVNDLESKIQSVANDVSSGFFPSGIICSPISGGSVSINSATTNPGSNTGCVFLGKAMQLNSSSDVVNIISIAGRQFIGDTNASSTTSNLTEAKPLAFTETQELYTLQFGLKPTKIFDINDGTAYGTLMFVTQLGGSAGSTNPLTGSRGTLLYGLSGSTLADSIVGTIGALNSSVPAANFKQLVKGVGICLLGQNGKKAELTIGSAGSQLSTNVLIDTAGVNSDC